MTEDQPTEEHEIHRQIAVPFVERALERAGAVFVASMLWALFLGWVFGEYIGHTFPFGVLTVAIGLSIYAYVIVRRNRD